MPFLGWLDSTAAGAPRWLQRGWGGVFLRAAAVTCDAAVESAKQAIKFRFPHHAPPDALAVLGAERGEVRAIAYVYEDDRAFANRIHSAWLHRLNSGGKLGLLGTVEAFGFTDVAVRDQGEWFSSKKWHAWVALPFGTHPWGPGPQAGDGSKAGEGKTAGSSMRSWQVRNLREVTASWCPSHTVVRLCVQIVDGAVAGDGSQAGDGSKAGSKTMRLKLGKATLS